MENPQSEYDNLIYSSKEEKLFYEYFEMGALVNIGK